MCVCWMQLKWEQLQLQFHCLHVYVNKQPNYMGVQSNWINQPDKDVGARTRTPAHKRVKWPNAKSEASSK